MSVKSPTFPQRQWIADRYGSYRGFLSTWWHRLLYYLGRYRGYRRVDWMAVERLVFVCKGNICRSAYAEAFALGRGLASSSCGMDTRTGAEADGDAIQAARLRGIDLSRHRAMPIQSMTIGKGDLLVVMEPEQAEQLKRVTGDDHQFTLLGIWGGATRPYIRDPYGASPVYFNNCFECIERSVDGIIGKISSPKKDD